jgi:hypothetical protein
MFMHELHERTNHDAHFTQLQAAPPQPRTYVPVNNTKDNPPCNTLFIGNLSELTNEDELRSLFASQPGFRQLKVVRGARSVTCFVEFNDVPSAMAVHQSQQVWASHMLSKPGLLLVVLGQSSVFHLDWSATSSCGYLWGSCTWCSSLPSGPVLIWSLQTPHVC